MSKKIIQGYKFRIYPTEEQACQIDKFIDLSRYVYNWGIAKEQEIYEQYKNGLSIKQFYTWYDLTTMFTKEKNNNPELRWLKELPDTTGRNELRNVVSGYKKFFYNQNENPPYFKSKKRCKKSFNTRNDRFNLENNCIKIEGIKERISLGFDSKFDINGYYDKRKVINPTITKDNLGDYYVSFSLEEEVVGLPVLKDKGIGIDVGIIKTVTLSNGKVYNHPNLDKYKRKRTKIQRHVTRDQKRRLKESEYTKTKYEDIPKSKRSIKRENKLNKIHRKIHNIINTSNHTITKNIVDMKPSYVCMETFSVQEIGKKNKNSYKELWSKSFYAMSQMLKYKCEKNNIPFIQAPMDFASTQICSNCGHQKKMYGNRIYKCPVCGMVEDRDINAAINLKNYGYNSLNNIGIVYY